MRERNETAYNLVMQINEIKPEQWGPWDEQDYQRIDAALRRAKAEGLDDAAKAICMYCNDPEWQKRDEDDNHESPYTRTMYPCAAYKIHDLIRELDARAAQIEEGAK